MLWTMQKIGCRIFQMGFGAAVHVIPWPKPQLVNQPEAVDSIPDALAADGIQRVLVVTDRGVLAAGPVEAVCVPLRKAGVEFDIFSAVHPNPSIADALQGLSYFHELGAEGIIAVGGGSSMDCAKMIAALAAVPQGNERKLGGLFKVTLKKQKKLPALYSVPTTAGTGSETTIVAVITDSDTHEKFTVMDFALLSKRVFLDADLTLSLPPNVTAQSGMDALTHAVEAFVNGYMSSKETRRQGREAAWRIFKYLPRAYQNGEDAEARQEMLTASFLAGQSFGQATVGYAHSIAHAVGGLTGMAHGELTGIVLPALLEWYGEAAWLRLAELADACEIGEAGLSTGGKARAFIRAVYDLRRSLGLSEKLPTLTEEELALVAKRAVREANPLYPVPRIMSESQCRHFLRLISE